MIELQDEILHNPQSATKLEWLETNGLGGFSSSTVIGLNTRRYHGLLTAATKPPVGRIVMLSKLEETLEIDGRRYELSSNQYPGAVHPQGFNYQVGFKLDPFPIFTYQVEDLRLEKSIFMVHGQNTAVVRYELTTSSQHSSVKLELLPLIAFRDYHSTTHENGAINAQLTIRTNIFAVTPYKDQPTLYVSHDDAAVDQTGYWYRNFQYAVEAERGLDFSEDLFNPCRLTFDLLASKTPRLIVSTESLDVTLADPYRDDELKRRRALILNPERNGLINRLSTAADRFIAARENGKTVIAGYHWFSDWGRDTMIALPGLTLSTDRPDIAKSILKEFAGYVDRGMLPNRFPDAGETPEYNTVDATLWFFEAIRAWVEYTTDYDFVRKHLYEVMKDIIRWHREGTRYSIHVDDDGLLYSGEPGMQLTWMDAKVGDLVVTPRYGKPVEIQALWYNSLRVMQTLADRFGDTTLGKEYGQMADQAAISFGQQFWNEELGCLYDVVDGSAKDASIRPNQVLAISLKHALIDDERSVRIMQLVARELLTSRGLRSLSPNDSRYRGRYEGGPQVRDSSYHQGTVWPWLMGPYLTACMKTFGEDGRVMANEWLANFAEHLSEACLEQVSEIYDGDAPHTPRGCVAQAWSVAEILRAAIECNYADQKPRKTAVASSLT